MSMNWESVCKNLGNAAFQISWPVSRFTAILARRHAQHSLTIPALTATQIFKPSSINFEELGIGGLDRQFANIFRRAFASRVFPPSVVERLGIRHVKGVLLHGPPGKKLCSKPIMHL